ncbi:MAG: rRNA (guanine966-N2)-methyltransferase [Blastocatellia bacterium]|jgi:16S rRNA (guanine(966)-N(2))-methyltransferase RsmD|nr:rRNA (guanine966-N2)-methyltransferase [Blastocatellia bacterium]
MRIVAGKYRGRKLKSPSSLETRPTSDRLRETLFNILAPRIKGARFLDLCAGSGAVGIEALSRAAAHATLVDQSRSICALIETNLEALTIDGDDVEVVNREATDFLRRRAKKEAAPFDVIFYDPPYATDYKELLDFLGEHAARLLAEEGVVIVEHHKKKDLKEELGGLKRYRALEQGDSCLSFYHATDAGNADGPSAQRA